MPNKFLLGCAVFTLAVTPYAVMSNVEQSFAAVQETDSVLVTNPQNLASSSGGEFFVQVAHFQMSHPKGIQYRQSPRFTDKDRHFQINESGKKHRVRGTQKTHTHDSFAAPNPSRKPLVGRRLTATGSVEYSEQEKIILSGIPSRNERNTYIF